MLFSRDDVAKLVNDGFEAAWESVRPVPIVRIDFGNGNVVTRTLHGNIASFVCSADGSVVDVLPGLYSPDVYRQRLSELRQVARDVEALALDKRAARLRQYHQGGLVEAKQPQMPVRFDTPKDAVIERPVTVLAGARPPNGPAQPGNQVDRPKRLVVEGPLKRAVAPAANPNQDGQGDVPADLASWILIAEDTKANETVRRRQVHELLVSAGAIQPAAITKKIYKDILHADLDDPYLGLGPTLFGSYPFAAEEKVTR